MWARNKYRGYRCLNLWKVVDNNYARAESCEIRHTEDDSIIVGTAINGCSIEIAICSLDKCGFRP
jgi:hypothetical protein